MGGVKERRVALRGEEEAFWAGVTKVWLGPDPEESRAKPSSTVGQAGDDL